MKVMEPHLRIPSSHTWGWRRGRAESHSEELEVSNRTYYRNEVVWGENSPLDLLQVVVGWGECLDLDSI